MQSFKRLFALSRLEKQKLLVSGVLFFMIIASYSITKELQHLIFSVSVGLKLMPKAKLFTVIFLVPFIFLDGLLVDRLKRHQILTVYLTAFSIIGFVFCIALSRHQDVIPPILGWLFFLYAEGYVVFLLGVFWAFSNSIHRPQDAEHTYGFIVSISKLGGILAAGMSYLFLTSQVLSGNHDMIKLRILLYASSSILAAAALFLYYNMRTIDPKAFQGYHTNIHEKIKRTGPTEGLRLMIKQPYVLGIFFIIFSYEMMVEVVNYQRLLAVVSINTAVVHQSIAKIGASLYYQVMLMQTLACILSFFIANTMLRILGTRLSLFIMPLVVFAILAIYFFTGFQKIFVLLYIILHALNYGINTPLREGLYIVTSRDIQLKSKFVIDGLAFKSGRCAGQLFNIGLSKAFLNMQPHLVATSTNIFFTFSLGLWFTVCTLVGTRYARSIKEDKIIS